MPRKKLPAPITLDEPSRVLVREMILRTQVGQLMNNLLAKGISEKTAKKKIIEELGLLGMPKQVARELLRGTQPRLKNGTPAPLRTTRANTLSDIPLAASDLRHVNDPPKSSAAFFSAR